MKIVRALGAAAAFMLSYGCSEGSFSGSDQASATGPAASEATQTTNPPASPPTDCVQGDRVSFNWTGEARRCIIDQGKTFNFDTAVCTAMPKASFDCSWESLATAMQDIGLKPTEKIERDRANGAKIVTCGQSADKRRIVVQWILAPDQILKCDEPPTRGMITTGCYSLYKEGEQPPKATTPEEREKQVYECLNTL